MKTNSEKLTFLDKLELAAQKAEDNSFMHLVLFTFSIALMLALSVVIFVLAIQGLIYIHPILGIVPFLILFGMGARYILKFWPK